MVRTVLFGTKLLLEVGDLAGAASNGVGKAEAAMLNRGGDRCGVCLFSFILSFFAQIRQGGLIGI